MRTGEPTSIFDPARSVRFDFARGHVELSDGEPQLLVPVAALASLLAGDSSEHAGRALGRAMGVGMLRRIAARLVGNAYRSHDSLPPSVNARQSVRSVELSTLVELLGGEIALVGLGTLRVERWGDALLFVIDPCAIEARANALLCGVFEGALAGVAEREVSALVVDRGETHARVLVGNAAAIAEAKAMTDEGAFFTDVVSKLHRGARRGEPQ